MISPRVGVHLKMIVLTLIVLVVVAGVVGWVLTERDRARRDREAETLRQQREQAIMDRAEVLQYGRAASDLMRRELDGVLGGERCLARQIGGLRVYYTDDIGPRVKRRDYSSGIAFCTAGVRSRDPRRDEDGRLNPYFGHDVQCFRVAYYLNDETDNLANAHLYRFETPDITGTDLDAGMPFVRCCLQFDVRVMPPFAQPDATGFCATDWQSDGDVMLAGYSRRRGLPRAVEITMRVTDARHAPYYHWDSTLREWQLDDGETDDAVQTFRSIVYFGHGMR